jgi:hypothetical protein
LIRHIFHTLLKNWVKIQFRFRNRSYYHKDQEYSNKLYHIYHTSLVLETSHFPYWLHYQIGTHIWCIFQWYLKKCGIPIISGPNMIQLCFRNRSLRNVENNYHKFFTNFIGNSNLFHKHFIAPQMFLNLQRNMNQFVLNLRANKNGCSRFGRE